MSCSVACCIVDCHEHQMPEFSELDQNEQELLKRHDGQATLLKCFPAVGLLWCKVRNALVEWFKAKREAQLSHKHGPRQSLTRHMLLAQAAVVFPFAAPAAFCSNSAMRALCLWICWPVARFLTCSSSCNSLQCWTSPEVDFPSCVKSRLS